MLVYITYNIESLPGDLSSLIARIIDPKLNCIVIKRDGKVVAGIVSPDVLRHLGMSGIPVTIPSSALAQNTDKRRDE